MRTRLAALFVALVVFTATQATALGLGEITLESSLNQPLAARIALTDTEGVRLDEVQISLAAEADFARFALERAPVLDDLRFAIDSSEAAAYLKISSAQPLSESFLSFVLATDWPNGRLLTEYTLMLQAPAFASESSTIAPRPPVRSIFEAPPAENFSIVSAPQEPVFQLVSTEPASASVAAAPREAAVQRLAAPVSQAPAPAGAMEEAGGPADSETSPAGAETVAVGATDTLWDIALRVRPDQSLSVQQTMVALQRLNSSSFSNNNINLVHNGAVLRIPDANQIRELSAQQAMDEVSRQNQAFAGGGDTTTAFEPLTAQPQLVAAVSPAARGELRVITAPDAERPIVSTDSPVGETQRNDLDNSIRALEDRLAIGREELDRVELQSLDLSERLTMLQEQIGGAQEIIRLRDLELAQLQQSLSARQLQPVPQLVDSQPTEPVAAAGEGPAERLLNTVLTNSWIPVAGAGLLILLLVLLLIARNRLKQKQYAREQSAVAEGAEDDFDFGAGRDKDLVFAASGAAALDTEKSEFDADAEVLKGLDGEANEALDEDQENQEDGEGKHNEDYDSGDSEDDAAAAFGARDDDDEDFEEDDETLWSDTESDANAEDQEELLAEVNALIGYQQYDEAGSMLRDAIVGDPNNTALRIKLLEVLAIKQDETAFSLQEAELGIIEDPEQARYVAELRQQLSGTESSSTSAGADAAADYASQFRDMSDLDELELEIDLEASAEVDDRRVLGAGAGETADSDPYQAEGIDAGDADSAQGRIGQAEDDFDFDLDLSDADFDANAELFSPEAEAEDREAGTGQVWGQPLEAPQDEENFDFNLDDFELDAVEEPFENTEFDGKEPEGARPDTAAAAEDQDVELPAEADRQPESEQPLAQEEPESEDPGTEGLETERLTEAGQAAEASGADQASDTRERTANDESAENIQSADGTQRIAGAQDADSVQSVVTERSDDIERLQNADNAPNVESADSVERAESEEHSVSSENVQSIESAQPEGVENVPTVDAVEQDTKDPVASGSGIATAAESVALSQQMLDEAFADLAFTGSMEESDLALEEDDENFDFLSGSDEAATKLDLARAYIDMGDKEGAQEILEEVVSEGTEAQIQDARKLLDRLQ